MKKISLAANQRRETGKGPARRLRAAGKVPAVFYGKKSEPVKLAVDVHEFKTRFDQAGSNPLFDLEIKDDGGGVTRTAILKERQVNPMDGRLIHLDFIEVFMDQAIEVTVPLEFTGKPVGVEVGGLFQATARDLRLSCMPDAIPNVIEVEVSGLEIGNSIHVGDIKLPQDVEVLQDAGLALATVLAPKAVEEEVVVTEEEEAAAAAEAEEKPEGAEAPEAGDKTDSTKS